MNFWGVDSWRLSVRFLVSVVWVLVVGLLTLCIWMALGSYRTWDGLLKWRLNRLWTLSSHQQGQFQVGRIQDADVTIMGVSRGVLFYSEAFSYWGYRKGHSAGLSWIVSFPVHHLRDGTLPFSCGGLCSLLILSGRDITNTVCIKNPNHQAYFLASKRTSYPNTETQISLSCGRVLVCISVSFPTTLIAESEQRL